MFFFCTLVEALLCAGSRDSCLVGSGFPFAEDLMEEIEEVGVWSKVI